MTRTRRGFTLVELLVVVAVTAVLVGLLLAAVQNARAAAARADCQNRMKQLALAALQYHESRQHLPPGSVLNAADPPPGTMPASAWSLHLLPHLEQSALWDAAVAAFAQTANVELDPPHSGLRTAVAVFACPADGRVRTPQVAAHHGYRVGLTSYLGVAGTSAPVKNGLLFNGSAVRLNEVTDGTSNTLLLGERPPEAGFDLGWWYAGNGLGGAGAFDMLMGVAEPDPSPLTAPPCGAPRMAFGPAAGVADRCAPFHFWSLHAGGANWSFADGSVRFLPYAASAAVPALSTRAGGEPTTG